MVRWSESELQDQLEENDDLSDASSSSTEHTDRASRVRVEIDAISPTMNQLLKMHWSDVQEQKDIWTALITAKTKETVETPARLTYVRFSTGEMDIDNLYASLKVPIDAAVHAGVLPDDDPNCISSITAKQRAATESKTVLTFESESRARA